MSTAVITDSTATLPAAVVAEHGIRVVPLQLVIDGGERIEGDGADGSVVVDALHRKAEISTSRPSPAMTLMTPGGKPAAVAASARMSEVPGVISEVLSTIVLPAATAGRIFQAAICSG